VPFVLGVLGFWFPGPGPWPPALKLAQAPDPGPGPAPILGPGPGLCKTPKTRNQKLDFSVVRISYLGAVLCTMLGGASQDVPNNTQSANKSKGHSVRSPCNVKLVGRSSETCMTTEWNVSFRLF